MTSYSGLFADSPSPYFFAAQVKTSSLSSEESFPRFILFLIDFKKFYKIASMRVDQVMVPRGSKGVTLNAYHLLIS
jgi:hypothetical protein